MTITTIMAIDFDKHAAATYAANFPGTEVVCDSVANQIPILPYADIITGGFPCQPHSLAGKRLASKDERDGGEDFVASIRRVKPRMFLGENVAGLMTSEDGRYARNLISAMEGADYVVQWRILDAVDYGVPQFRLRVWFWGIRRDVYESGVRHCWPAPTHQWPPAVDGLFGSIGRLPGVTVGKALHIWYPGCGWDENAESQLLTNVSSAETAGSESPYFPPSQPCRTVLNGGIFVVPPPNESPADRGKRLRQLRKERSTIRVMGGGSHPALRKGEESARDITSEPCTTLNKEYNHGDNSPVVEYRWSAEMLAKHPPASPASPASPVMAKWYKGGAEGLVEITDNAKHQPHQPHQPANTLNSGGAGHGPTFANQHLLVPSDKPCSDGRTWEEMHPPANPATPANTVRSRSPRDGGRCVENVIRTGLYVRRLSQLECLRLQSGPDDFRWPDGITKTAMYRIIGNGQASLMVWHLRRAMESADPRCKTHIDLYCGGGIGAAGWHGRFWSYNGGSSPPPTDAKTRTRRKAVAA